MDVSSAFARSAGARKFNQDAPHDRRGNGKKVSSILPIDLLRIGQPQVRLIDQRAGLERVPRMLTHHVYVRQPAQFVMH
jgi:hypothetical protein